MTKTNPGESSNKHLAEVAMFRSQLRAAEDGRILNRMNARAECRQEIERLTAIKTAAVVLLANNGGPTGGGNYFETERPDTHVPTRIEDFLALEQAVKCTRGRLESRSHDGTDRTR